MWRALRNATTSATAQQLGQSGDPDLTDLVSLTATSHMKDVAGGIDQEG